MAKRVILYYICLYINIYSFIYVIQVALKDNVANDEKYTVPMINYIFFCRNIFPHTHYEKKNRKYYRV